MRDDALNIFMNALLTENIEDEKFERYIDMFSKFLGYTNQDYKYNGTYLGQYLYDFMQVHRMLKNKDIKYREIMKKLTIEIPGEFELVIDQTFYVKAGSEVIFGYNGIDKNKIAGESIEIRVKFNFVDRDYIFCKVYGDFEENKLEQRISKDVKKFRKLKRIGRM